MAFLTQAELPARGLELAQSEAKQLVSTCNLRQTDLAAAPVGADVILSLYSQLLNWQRIFVRIRAIPGLPEYAKEQFADSGLDIVSEFDTMLTALDAVVAAIRKAFPQDGAGFLLRDKFSDVSLSGFETRQFAPRDTADLQAALAGLADTIG